MTRAIDGGDYDKNEDDVNDDHGDAGDDGEEDEADSENDHDQDDACGDVNDDDIMLMVMEMHAIRLARQSRRWRQLRRLTHVRVLQYAKLTDNL